MQKLGFSPAKKVFAYGSGDRNNGARSGNRTHFGSKNQLDDALSVHFGEAYQSFYMAQLYVMIRLSVLVSVLVSPVLFLPRAPLQEDSSDVSCCRYRYHGVAYLSLNFRILQHQAFIKPLQGF